MSTVKRPAPRTPEGRPPKRRATSSPEEGELDDTSGVSPEQPGPSASASPAHTNSKFKIPFPFKNKTKNSLLSRIEGPSRVLAERRDYSHEQSRGWEFERHERGHQRPPAAYERYEDDGRLLHRQNAMYQPERRPRGRRNVTGDHYEPSLPVEYYDRSRERDYDRREVERERYHSPPQREVPITAPVSLQSSTRSDSPQSVSRGRSRSGSVSPQSFERNKRRHRLPTPRSTTFAVSPICDDRQHNGSGYRGDHYEPYRRDTYRDREQDPRGQYQREELDDYDRYYRPGDSFELDRMRRLLSSARSPTYQLITPPKVNSASGAGLPPSTPLPPSAPPKDVKRAAVGPSPGEPLRDHEAVSFALRRPGAPRNDHSPPSLNEGVEKATPAPPSLPSAEPAASAAAPDVVVIKRKLVPVRRTREQEKLVYHRIFAGCGERDDYDVMTKLGEGTFGEVHKALHKQTGTVVALKRILMHNEKEGMPVTALREIKILKALKHPCVVDLLDMFVIQSKGKDSPMSVYMVFPYMDHDLAGLLENERVKLSPSQIKLYMKQLLEGTEYMHHNNIVHRDMKAANLLISNSGSLKIADFGLARPFDPSVTALGSRDRRYTNCVVTRWYRPPELLLGARQYGGEIDIWGIGCVLGEMIMRRPILPGNSDLDQLDKIWSICGSPNQQNWPDYDKLPGCGGQIRFKPQERRVKQVYDSLGKETSELMDRLLTLDPRERITASDALDHEYFWSDPLPADPKSLPAYEASHEFDQRGRRHQPVRQNEIPKPPVQHGIPPPVHNRNYRNEDLRQQALRAAGTAPPYAFQNGFSAVSNGMLHAPGPAHHYLPPPPPQYNWVPGPARNPASFGPNRPAHPGSDFGTGPIVGDRVGQRHQPSRLPPPPPGLPPRPDGLPRPLGNRPSNLEKFRDRGVPPFTKEAPDNGGLNYG